MKKIISFVCLICLLFNFSVFGSTVINITFIDVPNTHWAKTYIDSFVKNGVVAGYTDGTFKPDNNVTREEFCKLLVKSFNADKDVIIHPTTQTFADVEYGRWSHTDVEICSKFLTGYMNPFGGKPLFKPTDVATREDIAVALVKMLGYNENDVSSYGTYVNKFKDNQTISPNLRNYVGFAASKGLISGYPDGTFGAQRGITRAETLVMLDRALKVSIADEYENFDFEVNTSYRNEGKTVDIEIVSNHRVTVTINGEPLTLTDGAGYANKFARTYTYTFESEGEKDFIIEAKLGSVVKKEVVSAEYVIGTPKIKIIDCPSITHTSNVSISGEVSCKGVQGYEIDFTINGKEVNLTSNNKFYYTYSFEEEGVETLVFKADYKGKETKVEKKIEYSLYSPEIEIFDCPEEVYTDKVIISGKISDANKHNSSFVNHYMSLIINNKKVSMDSNGVFTETLKLVDGVNKITIIATNEYGKSTKTIKEINYIVPKLEENIVEDIKNDKGVETNSNSTGIENVDKTDITDKENINGESTAPIFEITKYSKTTSLSSLIIKGTVEENEFNSCETLKVFANGNEGVVWTGNFAGTWNCTVHLQNGENIITVVMVNESGKSSSQTITIIKTN